MIDYPFMRCLNPQRVVNSKGQEIVVPCRCCRACLMKKANTMSLQCSIEEEDYKYCVFFTLTYSNDNVPLALPVACANVHGENLGYILYNKCDRLSALGDTLGFDDMKRHKNPNYMSHLLEKINLGGYIPYLNPLDLQRFFKRFRKQLTKYTDEKIRYYACGEYGPRTFRPHFHGLLFFNEKETFENYAKCLRAAWLFGRIDASCSRSKAASYVARYVNSTVSLPRLYEVASIKPFSSHSVRFAQGFYQSKKEEIYETPPLQFAKQCRTVVGRNVEFSCWRSLASAFFPKCRDFDGKSYSELLQAYTILRTAKKIYGNEPISYIAHAIYSDGSDNECTRYFSYAYDIETKKKRLDARKFMKFTPESVPSPVITTEETVLLSWQRAVNAITSELYISKHFLEQVCKNDSYHEIERKIHKIQDFYKEIEYDRLCDWYSSQERYFQNDNALLRDMFLFFDNIYTSPKDWRKNTPAVNNWLLERGFTELGGFLYPDVDDKIQNNFLYKAYRIEVTDRFNKSIKHKELNDRNNIFIYETY